MKPAFRSLAASLAVLLATNADAESIALVNANLFNGVDPAIRENVTVLVRDGRIERIGDATTPVPEDYRAIDCEGNYLMPGLFDVHTHIDTLDRARRALESGVTTVRTASGTAFQDVGLRELVRAGKLAGPDVIAAGLYVTPDLGDAILADPRLVGLADGVDSDADLRLLVNVNVDRGADVIKTRGTQRAGLPDTDPR
ncbi:MAG: hypothetical protein OEX13_05570 [Gammaproteobacteria bacterium]|nr:hypothetical protein [Gammaproteobacteria bacterium]MDH5308880.1 hypothetical protein [Gammaproteobacteria bacterium]